MRRDGQAPVRAGRPALPVNTLAFLYGAGMADDPAWPRAAVYDPAGGHWYCQRFTLLPRARRCCSVRFISGAGGARPPYADRMNRPSVVDRQDRVAGAVVGSAVGDALGAPFEFGPAGVYGARFPDGVGTMCGGGGWDPGEATDDTQMAVLVAESLLERDGLDLPCCGRPICWPWPGGWTVTHVVRFPRISTRLESAHKGEIRAEYT
ncbi:ADP-ribosylglycohydrolase [Streptomyces sp. Ncost-T10-10d]|nr:ADP-ribosylglycohydrolase [Streptomyces sp. Ncost-T10-10d]